jgi:cytochrome o ubiquinol oxidase subunit IV
MHGLKARIIGFIASLVLTFIAYYIIVSPTHFNLSTPTAVNVIFFLALTQSIVQLVFFINVWVEEGPLWNLSVFMSTVSIIFVVVFFSIWIINHLNYNMQ